MKNAKFDEYIKKLRSGGSIELEPHDCAYFVSLFARYDENISFYVEISDGMVTLEPDVPNNFLKDAVAMANKKEQFCKNAKPCPECKTDQVQIIGWTEKAEWKCRNCQHKWTSETPNQAERDKYSKMSIDELLNDNKETGK